MGLNKSGKQACADYEHEEQKKTIMGGGWAKNSQTNY